MNILWIGSLVWKYEDGYRKDIFSSGVVSGSLFEQNIITGLEECGNDVDILSSTYYPDNKNHKKEEWSHNGCSKDIFIPHWHGRAINYLMEFIQFSKCLKQLDLKKYDIAIAYLVHAPFLKALKVLKKNNKAIRTVLICPDLFDMMDLGSNWIKRFAKKIEGRLLENYYKYIDGYVLFTEEMSKKLPTNDNYVVVEGVNSILEKPSRKSKEDTFIVLYAGSLQHDFGLENIISAFDYLQSEKIELHIYGDGALKTFIETKCKVNHSIKFFGFADHDTIVEKEKSASLLINCRNPNSEYTFYSFPSKTFEYMMSGTPFLTTRLKGIPQEYYDYLFCIDDNEPKTIADAILKIRNMEPEEINKRTDAGINYLLTEKNRTRQSERILSFIKKKLFK